MLKFLIIFLCYLCCLRQAWNAPIMKASGFQWTEPKGNGKGNLTLIMIPQNNSCNDTDMLIAVKSDYQVLSQDTQLLNLVINEYQNDTVNQSKCSESQKSEGNSPNTNRSYNELNRGNEGSRTSCNNVSVINHVLRTDDSIQYQQVNNPEPTENTYSPSVQAGECFSSITFKTTSPDVNGPKKINGVDLLNYNTKTSKNRKTNIQELSTTFKSDITTECVKQDYTNNGLIFGNKNNYNEFDVANSIPKENQMSQVYQAIEKLNRKEEDDMIDVKQNSKTDSLNYLNAVAGEEQHSELGSGKDLNSVNFYESEKRNLHKDNKQSNIGNNQMSSTVKENFTNEGEINVFKFLSAAQARYTTAAVTENVPEVFKLLRVTEPSSVIPTILPTQVFSRADDVKVNNNDPKSNIFNESEIKVSTFVNITEPTLKNKISENNLNNTPKNTILFNNRLNEVVNIVNKIKQEQIKEESDSRTDVLGDNQHAELVASEEGDFDSKEKILKGDGSLAASEEKILKKQLMNLLNSNYIGESDGNGNPESDPGTITTLSVAKRSTVNCVTKSTREKYLDNASVNTLGGRENIASVLFSDMENISTSSPIANISSTIAKFSINNATGNTDMNTANTNYTSLQTTLDTSMSTTKNSSLNLTSFGAIENSTSVVQNGAQATTGLLMSNKMPDALSTASPICRTSIIYICDPQNVTSVTELPSEKVEEKPSTMTENEMTPKQAAMQESLMKITLTPKIDCVSLFKAKLLSVSTTNDPNLQLDQQEHVAEKAVLPLIEPAMLLANSNEIPIRKNIPILVNSSSNNIGDVFLNRHDEKLAKLHANPSDPASNKDLFGDIPPEIDRGKTNTKKIVPFESSKSLKMEQGFIPSQVLKMRVAGKNLIVEQMPSYRADKFKKICESTPSNKSQSDELEPDRDEHQVYSGKESSMKPKHALKTVSTTKYEPDVTVKMIETDYTKNHTFTSTNTPRQSEITLSKKEEALTKEPNTLNVASMTPITHWNGEESKESHDQIATKMVTGIPNTKEFSNACNLPCSSDSLPINDLVGKYTTRKSKVKNKHFKNEEILLDEPPYSIISSQTKRIPPASYQFGSASAADEYQNSTPIQKFLKEEDTCDQNLNIPAGSVKEIVIQIVRNTRKPNTFNSKCSYEEDCEEDPVKPTIYITNLKNPTLKTFSIEKIKPGGYEVETSNLEHNHEQYVNKYPKQLENIRSEDNFNKDSVNSYTIKKNNLFDDFYVGKASDEDVKQALPQANEMKLQISDHTKSDNDALTYNDLKLIVDHNHVINTA